MWIWYLIVVSDILIICKTVKGPTKLMGKRAEEKQDDWVHQSLTRPGLLGFCHRKLVLCVQLCFCLVIVNAAALPSSILQEFKIVDHLLAKCGRKSWSSTLVQHLRK